MLLFSSHYPWYYLWLLPFVCLIPYVPMLYFTTACFYLYTTQLANPGPAMYYMFEWLYATTALLALWCMGAVVGSETVPRAPSPQAFASMRGTHDRDSFCSTRSARYFEKPEDQLSVIMEADPVCLYLETTNRCNLLCTTCPRTFEELEPEKDMSWELFTSIIDQFPKIARVVLHGVGEPMLVKELPRMIRYLKDRGVYVLFNTNGTLLTKANGQALIDAGLDELRVSLDAAESSVFQMVRGKDMFDRIVTNVGNFIAMQRSNNLAVAACFPLAYRFAGDAGAIGGLHSPGPSPGRHGGLFAENGVSPRGAGTGAA